MNETETRAKLIDPHLKEQGWGVVQGSNIRMEYPINKGRLIGNGKRTNPDKADYVLQYKGRNIAVIEAKAVDKYYTEGLSQAKSYAQRLKVRFAIATNGKAYYFVDLEKGEEKDISQVPTPLELWDKMFSNEKKESLSWKEKFDAIPRGGNWELRYYQQIAVEKVLDAISEGKKRILLTLATGTGKTAIAFQISWKLFKSRWNNRDVQRLPRILFLADRNVLADQAFNAFGTFDDDVLVRIRPSEIKKTGQAPKNGSIFFTIFQTFMSGGNTEETEENAISTPNFGQYPPDYFDFIIIDECHRGGANDESSWREILNYFSSATQLGLTATPKRKINADTYSYFGEPVYTYSLKDGINDGFLTPFRVKQIDTNTDEYTYTKGDTVIKGEIEEGKTYTENDFNRTIKIRQREEYRVKLFLDDVNKNEKAIVFCASENHSLEIRDIINQIVKVPNYCQRVTASEGKIGDQYLREFQDNEKTLPTILTTSQKLSTGVDAPEIRNIILLRPANSMIEFKQIVGRGTRLYEGKDYFTIYDFVGAYKHFNDPEWDGEPLEPTKPKTSIGDNGKDDSNEDEFDSVHTIGGVENSELCTLCGYEPCQCQNKKEMIEIILDDGKVRQMQSMTTTTFWSAEGKPISAQEFLKQLYGELPTFFKNEEDLKKQWCQPNTRKKLLDNLSEKGIGREQLNELKKLLNAENSDIYDVLSYISFCTKILDRKERVELAKPHFETLSENQKDFMFFVFNEYINTGVEELDDAKLSDYLILKYGSITDAKPYLGEIPAIRNTFIECQKFLY